MRGLGTRVRALAVALGLTLVSTAAVTVATAGPAAADPTCTFSRVSSATLAASCAGSDGTGTYEVFVQCDVDPFTPLVPPDPFDYFLRSGQVPTSQPVTLTCDRGGEAVPFGIEVRPPSVSMGCESRLGNVFCSLSYGLANPVQIRWTRNGVHVPAWDNQTHIGTTCSSGTTIGVTVSNPFWTVSKSWSGCRTGNP